MMHDAAEDDELEGELTEGYRGMADVEDLLWDDEPDQGVSVNERCTDMAHAIIKHVSSLGEHVFTHPEPCASV